MSEKRRLKTAPDCAENWSRKYKNTAKGAEESSSGEGMASRQGGSFNSILGRRKSPLASLPSEQQKATYVVENYRIINVSLLTFLVLGCPTAPGCLCLWGTLFCVGGRPPSLSFFRYFICQTIAAATLLKPSTQPSMVWGKRRGLCE